MEQRGKKCSFCSSSADQCKYLIAGPLVYICEVCIEKASNAIRAAEADGDEGGFIDLFDAIENMLSK